MAFSMLDRNRGSHAILPDFLYNNNGWGLYGCAGIVAPTILHSSGFTSSSSASVLNLFRRNMRWSPALEKVGSSRLDGVAMASSEVERTKAPSRQKPGELMSSKFLIPSTTENGGIELYSRKYFLVCAVGGLMCCGLTHSALTPVDVIKCNMQIDPVKYKSITGGFRSVFAEQGISGLLRGWAPTLLGYSVQGAGKYGFYEFFKYYYGEQIGAEAAAKHKTLLFLAASASAEFLADIGLCPFEAVKVRIQTQPGYAKGMSDGLPKMIASDGVGVLYRGILPLWGRQIPYTMMKFSTFEATVEALYKNIVPVPKEDLSSAGQLGVSFAAGYIAGIACAIISHPADNLVSYLNSKNGATVSQAVKELGTLALFTRGLPLRIFMIGSLTAAQWAIYDSFKVFVGLPTTGGH